MKKLALVIAVVLIAALSVTPVTASEFSAGGAYRALAISEDPGQGGTTAYFFRQRMRVAFNWAVNDNVSAQLRGDFAEFTWGDGYRPEQGTDTLMVDRAFVTIKQGPLTLKVGQQAGGWGLGTLWSDQFAGVQAKLGFDPFTINLLYAKESEGGFDGNQVTDKGANDDTDVYGAQVLYATEGFSAGLSYATQRAGSNDDLNGYSLHFTAPIGDMMSLGVEGVLFSGDNGAGMDYEGKQIHADLDITFSDAFKAGLVVLWADDVSSNEIQATCVADDWVFHPLDYAGALAWDRGAYGGACGVFDLAGNGSGAMGIVGDIEFGATEALTLYAKLGYVEPNDDTYLDSEFYAIGSFDYAWMPAVTISGGVGYVSPDFDDSRNDDPVLELLFRLGVSF